MPDLIEDCRINAIEQASENGFSRVPDKLEHDCRDPETDDWISLRKAKPNANDACKYPQACETINAGVLTVCDQGCALNRSACPNLDRCDHFVPNESKDRCD